jgi:hypothetical protein
MAFGECDWRGDLTVPSEGQRLRGGNLFLDPVRPGLGIELDMRVVGAHATPVNFRQDASKL